MLKWISRQFRPNSRRGPHDDHHHHDHHDAGSLEYCLFDQVDAFYSDANREPPAGKRRLFSLRRSFKLPFETQLLNYHLRRDFKLPSTF